MTVRGPDGSTRADERSRGPAAHGAWSPGPDDESPPVGLAGVRDVLLAQLELHRARLLRKVEGLTDEQLRTSVLPSGWSPLELLVHLTAVERRWLRWGFRAEPLDDPWRDEGPDGRWRAPEGTSVEEVLTELRAQWEASRAMVAGAALTERAAVGGRFPAAAEAPTLGWILVHLLQETARHVGHLDVVRELLDGAVGE